MKTRYSAKYRRTDTVCVMILAAVFFVFAVVNIIWTIFPGRKDYSENEKRKLASFPKITFSNIIEGKFADGVTEFFNDRFLFREQFISASKKLDTLYGVNYSAGGNQFVMLTDKGKDDEQKKNDLNKKLDDLKKETEAVTDPSETDPSEVTGLKLSKSEMKLTVGSGMTISLLGADDLSSSVTWEMDDPSVVEIVKEDGAKVDVKAKNTGKATLTCKVEGAEPLTCTFTIEALSVKEGENGIDVMTNGLFIYGDAVYSQGFFDPGSFTSYADTAAYYKKTFNPERMTVLVGPTSSIMIDNDNFRDKLPDQGAAFDTMAGICADRGLNCPNVGREILAHRDEYLYFRTDHHWTDRGAYYAYKAFAESVGFKPTPLENFRTMELTDSYQGSMYEYTQDERVKSFKDSVEAFFPTKPLTMTIHTKQGEVQTYDSAIMEWSPGYPAFLCGDNPYTVINVPENPQDLNVLVMKDSFGNAFVPYLAEHYGNIFVVDARYSDFNIVDAFEGYHFTDVIFVNNIEAASSPAWPTLYLKAVGVN